MVEKRNPRLSKDDWLMAALKMCEAGIDKVFTEAGFDFRLAGCSMCLAMNPDKLKGREISASSSNRNFKGRQGSPTGRTMLMSPVMVAAAAIVTSRGGKSSHAAVVARGWGRCCVAGAGAIQIIC